MAGKNEDLEIVIGADLSGLASDLAKTRSMFQGLARSIERVTPSPAGFTAFDARVKTAGRSIASAGAGLVSFAAKAAIAGGTLVSLEAGLSGVGSALGAVKDSVRLAADIERTAISFEVLLGSAERAGEMMADVRKYAAETPFGGAETTLAAKSLLAYGTAADQVIPTLKVLGNITAGLDDTTLKEMVYLYGTLQTQGRAYTKDITQFAGRGIRIWDALAKEMGINVEEVQKFVEEGRVGFPLVGRALESLQRAGGPFAGMLDKQSQSMHGLFEQMADAFDQAKGRFGKIVIEETGLKQAARDLEAFAKNVDGGMDRIRPAVRFVGDLAKGGAQLAYEFGRAGVAVASINLEGLSTISPQFTRLVADAKQFVANLQNMKFDKRQVAEMGLSLFEAVASPLAEAVDYASVNGKAFADQIQKNFVEPWKDVRRAAEQAQAFWDDSWVKKAGKGVDDAKDWISRQSLGAEKWDRQNDIIKQEVIDRSYLRDRGIDRPATFKDIYPANDFAGRDNSYSAGLRKMADVVKFGSADDSLGYFNPPTKHEPTEHVKYRYDLLQSMIKDADFLVNKVGLKQLEPHLANLKGKWGPFVEPYASPRWGPDYARQRMDLLGSRGSAWLWREDYVEPPPSPLPKTAAENFSERLGNFRDLVRGRLDQDDIRGYFGKMYDDIRRLEGIGRMVANPLGAAAALGPLGSLSPGLLGQTSAAPQLKFEDKPDPHLLDLAKKVKDDFDPLAKLDRELDDLQKARAFKLITPKEYDFARGEKVQALAKDLNVGQPAKLPDAVTVGSQEDARLLANFFSGTNRQATTEDLLTQIRDALLHMRDSNAAMERAPVPRPVNISPLW